MSRQKQKNHQYLTIQSLCLDFFQKLTKKITDSAEIEFLLSDEETWAEATKKMLQVQGYTVTGNNIDSEDTNGDGCHDTVTLTIDGNDVRIKLEGDPGRAKGHTNPPDANGVIEVIIYDMKRMTPNKLYLVLGHEMIHVEHYASGQMDEWAYGEDYNLGQEGAEYLSELAAWSWVQPQLAMMPCAEVYKDVLKWFKDNVIESWPGRIPAKTRIDIYLQYSQSRWSIRDCI